MTDVDFINAYNEVILENFNAVLKQNFMFQTQIKFLQEQVNELDLFKEKANKLDELVNENNSYQHQIDSLKIKYYEFGNINKIENVSNETINSLKKDIDKLYYRSAKLTVSNDKYYYSIAAAKNDVPLKNNHEYQKVIDSPEFWRDLNNITIVKLKE